MRYTNTKVLLPVGLGLAVAFGAATNALAGSASTTFQVTATVNNTCSISATNLNFGTYSGAQLLATSNVTTTCSMGEPYHVDLNAGTAAGATATNRAMTGPGGAVLHYDLFRDASRTLNWGNTPATDHHGTGTGSPQTHNVYGRVPAGGLPAPGSYMDTITAMVTW